MKKGILGFIVVGIVIIVIGVVALTNKGGQAPVSPENTLPPATTEASGQTAEQPSGQAGATQMSDEDVKEAQDTYTDMLSAIAAELGYTLEVLEEKIDSQSLTEDELKKCAASGLAIAW